MCTQHIRGDNRIIICYVTQFICAFLVVKAKQIVWNAWLGHIHRLAVLDVQHAPKERTVQPKHLKNTFFALMAHTLIQKAAWIVNHVTQAFDVRVLEWMHPTFVLMEHIAMRRVPWSVYSARQVIGEIKYILYTPDEFGTATVKHNMLPQLPGTLRPI